MWEKFTFVFFSILRNLGSAKFYLIFEIISKFVPIILFFRSTVHRYVLYDDRRGHSVLLLVHDYVTSSIVELSPDRHAIARTFSVVSNA